MFSMRLSHASPHRSHAKTARLRAYSGVRLTRMRWPTTTTATTAPA